MVLKWRRIAVLAMALVIVTGAAVAPRPASAKENQIVWRMASVFPGGLIQFGNLGKRFAAKLAQISGGAFKIEFYESGALVPQFESFDAVAGGAVDAAWSTGSFWMSKDPAFALFSSVPFGPDAAELAAWIYEGGGAELMDRLYKPYGLKPVICGVVAPEAAGWFRKEIKRVRDFKGLKMRTFGLGAKVLTRLGVVPQLIAVDDILSSLERGSIDAAEFSIPAIDLRLGFHKVAKYYYFPGWHQQSTLLEFIANRKAWLGLSDIARAQVEISCGDTFREGMAEGDALQVKALIELRNEGVEFRRWPPKVLDKLRKSWTAVASDLAAKSPNFKKIWTSYTRFREEYRMWRELGYLP